MISNGNTDNSIERDFDIVLPFKSIIVDIILWGENLLRNFTFFFNSITPYTLQKDFPKKAFYRAKVSCR